MPRIQGLDESGIKTADALLKSGEGYLFHATIAYKGMTAGEICTFIDGLTVAGHDEVPIVFPAAQGTMQLDWPQGKLFETGIFWNKGASAGEVFMECTFK